MNSRKLYLDAPINRWDEAIPMGNGLLGVLLWGDGRTLKLSLDRGDLWDDRTNNIHNHPDWHYSAIQKAVADKDPEQLQRIADLSKHIIATKLPVGRLEITFAEECPLKYFELNMAQALGYGCDNKHVKLFQCFASSNMDSIRFKSKIAIKELKIIPPKYNGKAELVELAGGVKSAGSLGYKSGTIKVEKRFQYYIQPCAGNMHYGIFVMQLAENEYAIFIRRADNLKVINSIIQGYRDIRLNDFETELKFHRQWWQKFWKKSSVALPDKRLEQHYYLCRYFYGSASRAGAPPIPLQGVWTADDNTLPPWRGDYHHDLNTQFTYIAYHNSGDFDAGRCFLDFIFSQVDTYRACARDYYGKPGIAIPGVASLNGQSLGGWPQYSFSPTCSIWVATMFVDYWKYTGDVNFLQQKAYPICAGVAEFILAMLKIDKSGKYYLPLSSSPEIHDASLDAYLTPNSNYDLALMQRLFSDLATMAKELNLSDDWQGHLNKLPELSVDNKAGLKVSPDENLQESHRHHSHLMAIYPLKLWGIDDPAQAKIIRQSLHHIDKLGTGEWVGYSFSWMAALNAYAGNGDRALRLLNSFMDGFISRNGFHLNGDYKDLGYSNFKYRPFTLEGNFAVMQAVHEMLLQSKDDIINIFPALPGDWESLEFTDLRAGNNIKVSAKMENGKLVYLKLLSPINIKIKLKKGQMRFEKTIELKKNKPQTFKELDFLTEPSKLKGKEK